MPLTPEVRAYVWDNSGGRCAYCNQLMHPIRDFTVDHVVAVARGGTDDPTNLVAACRFCNSSKNARDVGVFLGATPALPKPRRVILASRVGSGWVLDMKKFRRARRDAALSLRALGEMSGVSYVTLQKIETGQTTAHPSTTLKVAKALMVDPADLMSEVKIDADRD